ncbi:hypothetical protein CsSME_00032815 [Camellia sinensis var. sinensis]
MTGLKLSALSQIKLLSIISTIDDLNYPEKTLTYYIVNAPYIFSACWKVVKPLLHERTRKKIQVLSGSGQDDLLKVRQFLIYLLVVNFFLFYYYFISRNFTVLDVRWLALFTSR